MKENVGYLKSNINNDELYTPYYAVEPIVKYIPKDSVVWCPFDEKWSAFPNTLEARGYQVVRTSITEGYDFFEYEPEHWDLIVSNPPFSQKDRVFKRLYELGKPFAILLSITSLQGKTRYKYFENGIQLLSFDSRICFHDVDNMDKVVKGSPFATGYFCRDLLPRDLIVEKLNFYEKPLIKEQFDG